MDDVFPQIVGYRCDRIRFRGKIIIECSAKETGDAIGQNELDRRGAIPFQQVERTVNLILRMLVTLFLDILDGLLLQSQPAAVR